MINFFNYKIDKKYFKYFLFLGWISIWASLSFDPNKLLPIIANFDLYIPKISLFYFLDISRGSFQIFYFIALIIITIQFIKTQKKEIKSNIFFFLFFALFLIETLSLMKSDNSNMNIYFIICSMNALLTIFILKNFFSENDLIFIFKLSIIFLIFLLIFFGLSYIFTAYNNGITVYNSWGSLERESNYSVPRPTGLARTALIIFIVLSFSNFFKKPFNKISYLMIIFTVTLLILFSSRTAIFLFFLYLIFYFFYLKIFKLKKIFKLILNFLIIPITIIIIVGTLQYVNKHKEITTDYWGPNDLKKNNVTRIYPKIKSSELGNFSSGRYGDWKKIIEKNQNIFLGNGTLGDRYLINQSASNLIFYTYSSSGIIGSLIIIYISILTFYYACKNIFSKKSKLYPYKVISSVIVMVLMMRSILETSYGVFGIDYILFCLCFSLIFPYKNSHESN